MASKGGGLDVERLCVCACVAAANIHPPRAGQKRGPGGRGALTGTYGNSPLFVGVGRQWRSSKLPLRNGVYVIPGPVTL